MALVLGTPGDDFLSTNPTDTVRGLGGNDFISATTGEIAIEYALGDGHDRVVFDGFFAPLDIGFLDLFGVSLADTVFYRIPNNGIEDLLVGFRTGPGSIRIFDQSVNFDALDFFDRFDGFTFTPDLDYVRDDETAEIDRDVIAGLLRDLPVGPPSLVDDVFETASPVTVSVFNNDGPSDDPRYVTTVNGDPLLVGTSFTTAAGATLSIDAVGRVEYNASAAIATLQPGDVVRDSHSYSAGFLQATVPTLGGPTADATLDLYFGYDLGADFFGQTLASAGFLDADGGERLVNLHTPGDRDRFVVFLEEGVQYQFDWRGTGSDAGTLGDPFLLLFDAADNLKRADDDGGIGFDSRIVFTAPETGIYQLELDSVGGASGIGLLSSQILSEPPVPPVAEDDAFGTLPLALLAGNLMDDNGDGPDTGSLLSLLSVNGLPLNGGARTITLDSGAVLEIDAHGDFTYAPGLAALGNVLAPSFTDFFVYELIDNDSGLTDFATVAVTVDLSAAIFGTAGDEGLFAGTDGDDFIILGTGNDAVRSRAGDDVILGGDGTDKINGLAGNNTYIGGNGGDIFQFTGTNVTPGSTTTIVDLDFSEGDRISMARFGTGYFDDSVNPDNFLFTQNGGETALINSFDDLDELAAGGTLVYADDGGALRLDFNDLAGDPLFSILLANVNADGIA